jgi:hypothetical protein
MTTSASEAKTTEGVASRQQVCSRLDGYYGDYDDLAMVSPLASATASGVRPELLTAFTDSKKPERRRSPERTVPLTLPAKLGRLEEDIINT